MDLETLLLINATIFAAGIGAILGTFLFLKCFKWMLKKGYF